ncbi:hypothetical protein RRG08_029561 [Elysia crispata]|uniref:Endonuclease/exonuclease/phosphatase domain-containing protein n=1 Tax=Elysia crispata TaxID=231223 RepID=A0AAE1EE60_9GAST|nr:hypothetical protein RRG08_029561 [Elysia crispata]
MSKRLEHDFIPSSSIVCSEDDSYLFRENETRLDNQPRLSTLGEDGDSDSAPELMMARGESRKDLSDWTPSSSARSLRIASWNVRTLYEAEKCVQSTREMQRYRLDILGDSETHWIQSGQRKPPIRRTCFSNRGININILQLYGLTNAASEEFYDQLQRITEKLPRKDVNIIMGDANAKVGSDNISYEEVMGKQGLGVMNDNGEIFADFCSLNDLVIGGTIFPHKDIHKATWVSPDGGTENQIDHICISRKLRRSLQDVRVFRGADIGSDHHLVIATFQLKLKRYSRNPTTKRFKFQVNLLQGNKITDFGITLKNRFQPLEHLDEDMEAYWSQVKDSFIPTCKEVLGKKDHKHKDWISQESLNRLSERREKKAAVNNSRTCNEKEAAQREYSDVAKEVKRSIKNDKEAFTNALAERAEKAAQGGHMRTL